LRKTSVKEERGQSLIEFAFGALVLIVLLAGIVDLGRGFYSYVVIANAAREGARYCSVHPDDLAGVEAAAQAKIVLAQGATLEDPPCACADGSGGAISCTDEENARTATVAVDYDFQAATPLISRITGGDGTIHLRSVSEMHLEGAIR
jgi:Flp pilus assembly protein TadG